MLSCDVHFRGGEKCTSFGFLCRLFGAPLQKVFGFFGPPQASTPLLTRMDRPPHLSSSSLTHSLPPSHKRTCDTATGGDATEADPADQNDEEEAEAEEEEEDEEEEAADEAPAAVPKPLAAVVEDSLKNRKRGRDGDDDSDHDAKKQQVDDADANADDDAPQFTVDAETGKASLELTCKGSEGRIIGKGGETIRYIEARFRVKIDMKRDRGTCVVTGPPEVGLYSS
jgi:hypothetical protein